MAREVNVEKEQFSNNCHHGRSRVDDSGRGQTQFPIFPLQQYDLNFPHFRQPEQIGCFSVDGTVDGERNFYNDSRKEKVYYPPKHLNRVDFDLCYGYHSFIKKDENIKDRLNFILKWILHNKHLVVVENENMKRLNCDFVMWRGHLTKIICTPYNRKESWAMAVCLFNGTYYMSEVETEDNRVRRENMTDRDKQMTYWGYKFEQYVTSENTATAPNTSLPVDNHDAFCITTKSKLNNHSLLYCGEVDCKDSKSAREPPGNYLELKTSRIWYTENNARNFHRFKLIKWWAQSFLVGIPEVVCGFRDDDGIVENLNSFKTSEMPRQSKQYWSGSIAFNFCDQFLSFVKSVVTCSDPETVYLFERDAEAQGIHYQVLQGPEHRFLLEWYTKEFI